MEKNKSMNILCRSTKKYKTVTVSRDSINILKIAIK